MNLFCYGLLLKALLRRLVIVLDKNYEKWSRGRCLFISKAL